MVMVQSLEEPVIIKRILRELVQAVHEVLKQGLYQPSICFISGTNFGFMNGCSARNCDSFG